LTDSSDTMGDSPQQLVADGYDAISEAYLSRFGASQVRAHWLRRLVDLTQPGDRILDLGCGPGVPVASTLVDHGRQVVGVDGSRRQIELARSHVTSAQFIEADMCRLQMNPASFDGVCAFYSITHLPREFHRPLFEHILKWLRPGGVFLASLGVVETEAWTGEWMGAQMFFSHFDAQWYVECLQQVAFQIEVAEIVAQDDEDGEFLWIVARRPA
jgi:SAM-dependent methyltransferase